MNRQNLEYGAVSFQDMRTILVDKIRKMNMRDAETLAEIARQLTGCGDIYWDYGWQHYRRADAVEQGNGRR